MAVTSAILISLMIMVVVFVISMGSFLARSNISTSSYKEMSLSLAKACVQKALFKLASSSVYAGNETITVASDTCRIVSVIASGTNEKVISTQAEINDSFTNLKVTVTSSTLSITRWEEVPNF
ncbi:MAG: hypothetical protein HY432_00570 [Candidatus Liptonbacteria bacterium]|nr:hypothetical protein [Candidatus Liptonbacteria bacterium]